MVHFAEVNQAPSPYLLLQILANNIDNGGRGIGLRIYVRYCGSNTSFNDHSFFYFTDASKTILRSFVVSRSAFTTARCGK